MKIAIVGQGKMGSQITARLIKDSHEVIAVDPSPKAVQAAVELGAKGANDRADALSKFGDSQVIVWLMIPAAFVTDEIAAWLEILPKESLLIDGGNTDFRQTAHHVTMTQKSGVDMLDVGVSGGILGLKSGFSMMVGGPEASYELIKPILESLARPRGGHEYFGESGSGHYVKMVHNAIEYGMMESIAEGYEMLRLGPFKNIDLAKAGTVWQKGSVIESQLNELATDVARNNINLDGVSGYVAESGEARWTLEVARDVNITLPVIQTALDVRVNSGKGEVNYATKMLAELRNKFGGHAVNKDA